MRVVYKIILGLVLFNAFLTLYNPLFNTSLSDNTIDYESAEMEQYNLNSTSNIIDIIFTPGNIGAMIASASILIITVIAGAVLRNPTVIIGVGIFVSIVVGLYVKMSAVISKIGTDYGAFTINGIEYNIILGLMTITGIAIGLLVVFSVVDMFAPASARE